MRFRPRFPAFRQFGGVAEDLAHLDVQIMAGEYSGKRREESGYILAHHGQPEGPFREGGKLEGVGRGPCQSGDADEMPLDLLYRKFIKITGTQATAMPTPQPSRKAPPTRSRRISEYDRLLLGRRHIHGSPKI